MNLDFINTDELPQDHAAEFEPDYIQFLFGQKNAPGVIGSGGFFAVAETYHSRLGAKNEPIVYEFQNGSETGFMFPRLSFCILAQVTIWVSGGNGSGEPFTRHKSYVPGSKSDTRVYSLVRDFGDWEPVILRLSGKVRSAGWKDTTKEFRNKIIKPVATVKKRSIPDYLFWCPVQAGPPMTLADHNVRVTPPMLAIDDFGDMGAVLKELYIGEDLKNVIVSSLWDEAQAWKLSFLDSAGTEEQLEAPMAEAQAIPAQEGFESAESMFASGSAGAFDDGEVHF